jgi:hypothetical protein
MKALCRAIPSSQPEDELKKLSWFLSSAVNDLTISQTIDSKKLNKRRSLKNWGSD